MMNRYCIRHSHRGSSRAYRLIAARHALDDAHQHIIEKEHAECAQCWRDTALALSDAAHAMLIRLGPLPEMDSAGNVFGPVMDELYERIESALECEELDRRDLHEEGETI
jgi:hypothetical protein